MDYYHLAQMAREAQTRAYVPYSHFPVGAALLTEDGHVFLGCNIENASYSLTNCAERTAIFKAVSEGKQNFKAIAIAGNTDGFCVPCGACRQVLVEFAPQIDVILVDKNGRMKISKAAELLPEFFSQKELHSQI